MCSEIGTRNPVAHSGFLEVFTYIYIYVFVFKRRYKLDKFQTVKFDSETKKTLISDNVGKGGKV